MAAEGVLKLSPVGVNLDIPPAQVGPEEFTYVVNMTNRNRAAVRVDGYNDAAGTLLHPCDFVIGNRRPENQYFFAYMGDAAVADYRIAVTNLFSHFDVTPTIAPTDSVVGGWTGSELNGLLMVCNGIDVPWWWNGDTGTVMAPLPNFPAVTTFGWLKSFKYFAIGGDITSNGVHIENQFYWSASVGPGLPPQNWTPMPSNDAGDNILAATPGTIIDGHALRDHFILAKNHSLYLLNFVGGQFVFTVHKLSVTTGALTSNCMVEETGYLYIFSDGDIVRTDGQSIESIATQRVKRTIFGTMNQEAYRTCYVCNYVAQDEIWFCYPTGANVVPNIAAVYDHIQGVWGFRDIPSATMIAEGIVTDSAFAASWDSDTTPWEDQYTRWAQSGTSEIEDGLLMASTDDLLYGVGLSLDANGADIPSYVEKASMDFEQITKLKMITQVWPYIVAPEGSVCQVRVGSQQHESDPILWSADQPFVVGTDQKVDVFAQGRLLSLHIEGPPFVPWSLQDVDLRFNVQGQW